jgi:beta-glucosidase-like glycosyl hydrolase
VKPPLTQLDKPIEPLVINIIRTQDEKLKERQKQLVSEIVKELPLSIKIGQMIASYPPKYDFVEKYQIGGVVLNQNFIKDTLKTRKMIAEYNKNALIPLFFAIDQEGGMVNRLKHIKGYKKTPSAMKLGTSFTEKGLLEYAYNTGVTMMGLGINVNLAPSLDISGSKKALMYIQERSLGNDPSIVKRKADALIDGYSKGGVLVYPGYSDVGINSDVSIAYFGFPAIKMLKNFNLFITLANKIDGIMMSSVIYSDFDSVPAIFSKDIISLIRIPNPDILVMTDDLYAPALRMLEDENLSMITTKAFIAGNDILLILWDAKVPVLIEAIKETLTLKPDLETQISRSVERIILSKEKVYPGLIEKLHDKWVKKKSPK